MFVAYKVGLHADEVIFTHAPSLPQVSAIKNTAPQFATADYFASRFNISSALHNAVKLAVEEPLYVTVPFFFMSAIKISPTVATKQLESAVQFQVYTRVI